MGEEIGYMTGIILVGFVVNYLLRAFPFLLFAGRSRPLPAWFNRLGSRLSVVVLGGLVFYSFATLETIEHQPAWLHAWPYLAGAVTIGLQLWRRNALLSIVVGTILYMCLLNCGCTSTPKEVTYDMANPAVKVNRLGARFAGESFQPHEVAIAIHEAGIPKDRVIHVQIDFDEKDRQSMVEAFEIGRSTVGFLAAAGYSRSVLVTKRHADAKSEEPVSPAVQRAAAPVPPRVRVAPVEHALPSPVPTTSSLDALPSVAPKTMRASPASSTEPMVVPRRRRRRLERPTR